MRCLNKKVASFSLTEMLVVMLISSMVVGVIYFSYYIVHTYHLTLSNRLEKVDSNNLFLFNLITDIDRSERVWLLKERLVSCEREQPPRITYEFLSKGIVRVQGSRVDTFTCSTVGARFFLKNKTVTNAGLIDAMEMEILADEASRPAHRLFLRKHYDASVFIQNTLKDSLF